MTGDPAAASLLGGAGIDQQSVAVEPARQWAERQLRVVEAGSGREVVAPAVTPAGDLIAGDRAGGEIGPLMPAAELEGGAVAVGVAAHQDRAPEQAEEPAGRRGEVGGRTDA